MGDVAGAQLLLNASETIGTLAGGGASGGSVNLQGNTLTVGSTANLVPGQRISGSASTLTASNSRSTRSSVIPHSSAARRLRRTSSRASRLSLPAGSPSRSSSRSFDVSFGVAPGEHAAIVGANGVGKSTILRILSGVIEADGGEFTVNGSMLTMTQDVGMSRPDDTLREMLIEVADAAASAVTTNCASEPVD